MTTCADNYGRWVADDDEVKRINDTWADEHPCIKDHLKLCYGGNSLPRWVNPNSFSWQPYSCSLSSIPANCVQILGVKRIVVTGDSHAELLFGELRSHNPDIFKHPVDFGIKDIPFIDLTFVKDTDGRNDFKDKVFNCLGAMAPLPSDGKIVVISNFGQHPADGRHRWSIDRYRTQISIWCSNALKWRDIDPINRVVMWVPTPFAPLRNDGWVRAYGDQRTLQRISTFNYVAGIEMLNSNIPVIDNASPVMSFLTLSDDAAHFSGRPRQFQAPIVLSGVCRYLSAIKANHSCDSSISSKIGSRFEKEYTGMLFVKC